MRRLLRAVRDGVSKITGFTIVPNDIYASRARILEWHRTREILTTYAQRKDPVVLDVGAHKGESVEFYREIFPEAAVYSFEPEPQLYSALVEKYGKEWAFDFALSDKGGEVAFHRSDSTVMSSIEAFSPALASQHQVKEIRIRTERGDDFLDEHGIAHVDILKINVQGHEAKVLAGFSQALKQQHVDLVVVEINCGDRYARPVQIYEAEEHLIPNGYMLVDIPLIKVGSRSKKIQMMHSIYTRRAIWDTKQD